MLSQVKECQRPPGMGINKGAFSPRAFGGNMALPTPWFQASGLWNYERVNFCCFKPESLGVICYDSLRKLIHFPFYLVLFIYSFLTVL